MDSSSNNIPTLHFPRSMFSDDFNHVYEPAEDSFLLLDALELDLESIRETTSICMECGSGSGIIITALSKSLNRHNFVKDGQIKSSKVLMLATDVNEFACKTTLKCAKFNRETDIAVVNTNLADGLLDRLENQVDLLIFNPPYVPTDKTEEINPDLNNIRMSWAGGKTGRHTIDIFMKSYVPRLLSRPHGKLYLVALEQNGVDELMSILLDEHGIRGDIVIQRRCGIEKLYVLKFGWIQSKC